ncbi:hypothetical protein EV122DRAFT_287439 [Schizophyllum commune]
MAVQIAFVPDGAAVPERSNSSSIQPPIHLPSLACSQTYSSGRESSPGYRRALRPSSPAKSAE